MDGLGTRMEEVPEMLGALGYLVTNIHIQFDHIVLTDWLVPDRLPDTKPAGFYQFYLMCIPTTATRLSRHSAFEIIAGWNISYIIPIILILR